MGNNQSNYMQQSIPQQLGVIEVYRPSRLVGAFCEMIIFFDDKAIGEVKNGGKIRFQLPPGIHELKVKINWMHIKSNPFSFQLHSGEFLKMRTSFPFGSLSVVFGTWMFKWMIHAGRILNIEKY